MINKVILLGTILTKEYRDTKNGEYFCTLWVSTSKKYTDSSGSQCDDITMHIVNFFDRLGETVNKKASIKDLIYIEGEITNNKVIENGISRVVSAIKGSHMYIIKQ